MNKLVILCMVILVISVLVMIICMISYLDKAFRKQSTKIEDITLSIVIVLSTLSISYLMYHSIKYPQPTFREVCEANNGTYIANNGRAGNSCIYNK